jgi:hypothetical protein
LVYDAIDSKNFTTISLNLSNLRACTNYLVCWQNITRAYYLNTSYSGSDEFVNEYDYSDSGSGDSVNYDDYSDSGDYGNCDLNNLCIDGDPDENDYEILNIDGVINIFVIL